MGRKKARIAQEGRDMLCKTAGKRGRFHLFAADERIAHSVVLYSQQAI